MTDIVPADRGMASRVVTFDECKHKPRRFCRQGRSLIDERLLCDKCHTDRTVVAESDPTPGRIQ